MPLPRFSRACALLAACGPLVGGASPLPQEPLAGEAACAVGGADRARCAAASAGESAGPSTLSLLQTKSSGKAARSGGADPHVKFFEPSMLEKLLPAAPKTYPEQLQGVFWMDQAGAYGTTDFTDEFPAFCMTFGDSARKLDKQAREIDVAVWGPAFAWQNNPMSYAWWGYSELVDFHKKFTFNEDYTRATVKSCLSLSSLGTVCLPDWFMRAEILLQGQPSGACPPGPGASKAEVSECAVWVHKSQLYAGIPLMSKPVNTYYFFRVADREGNQLEPYHTAYQTWATTGDAHAPNATFAKSYLMVNLNEAGGLEQGRLFVGTRSTSSPEFQPEARLCQSVFTADGLKTCAEEFMGFLAGIAGF